MKRMGLANERDGTSVQCGSIRTRVEPCGKSLQKGTGETTLFPVRGSNSAHNSTQLSADWCVRPFR